MKLFKVIKYFFFLLTIWFIVHSLIITADGLNDGGEKADFAIVLGNKVNTNGTLSTRLEKRLECALNLYKSNRVNKILVSGGFGIEGFYEGSKMKDYLMQKLVPDSCIIVDNKGDNTIATVENTLKLKDSLNFKSLIVVSQYYHITRTKKLFRKRGFNKVFGVSPFYFEIRDLYSLIREFFAFYIQ